MKSLSQRRAGLMAGRPLTLRGLLSAFWPQVLLTWTLTLVEVALFALIPLLIGQAIDGLLERDFTAFWQLGGVLGALVLLGTGRRVYDTRAYGFMRVILGRTLSQRAGDLEISRLNARLDMGRELVDFLEREAPESMGALLRTIAAIAILASFDPMLALSSGGAGLLMLAIYALAHRRFYNLNARFNEQIEKQVGILETRSLPRLGAHLLALRKTEIRVSDTEALIYGLIFCVLLAMVMFNLWFATLDAVASAGRVFAIVAYSWDFVEGALALPATLQSLSRLSEITKRINHAKDTA